MTTFSPTPLQTLAFGSFYLSRSLGAARAIWLSVWLASAIVLPNIAHADQSPLPIGYFSWDVTNPGVSGQFDIVNLTGANSSGEETWPVSTAVSLSGLILIVNFTDGSSATFADSYFNLSSDGYSFDGSGIAIGGGAVLPTNALLTGRFSPSTVTLFDSRTATLASSFSAAIAFRDGGLTDGDLQLIEASPLLAPVPEPGTAALSIAGLIVLMLYRRPWRGRAASAAAALCVVGTLAAMPASAAVKLSAWTAPSSGTAGSDYVNVTATGVVFAPGQTIANANITLAASCGGAPAATVAAASAKLVAGSSWRIQFILPATLASGTYAVAVSGMSSGGVAFNAANCSQVAVTAAPGGDWTTLIGRDWALVYTPDEAFKCMVIQAPQDLYISAFHSVSPPGDYQRILTVSDALYTLGAFDCAGAIHGNHGVYMSGVGGGDLQLPPGAAMLIRAGQYVILNIHLVSAQPVRGPTEVQVRTLPAAAVTSLVEMQILGFANGNIPADAPSVHELGGHCFAQSAFDLIAVAPRMNSLGTRIRVTRRTTDPGASDETLLDKPYSSTSELTYSFANPVHAAVGDRLEAICSFVNPTGAPVFVAPDGPSYAEQCLVGLYRTPPPAATPSLFQCPMTGILY